MQPRRILIVEDHEDTRFFLKRLFEKRLNCSSVVVESAAEAMGLLRLEKFDCIVSDLDMPEVEGEELVKFVERNEIGTPVVIFSGRDLKGSWLSVRAVRKPDYQKLTEVVEKILSREVGCE